jgi:hypothetical protein
MNATKKRVDLHAKYLRLAKRIANRHFEMYDGEKCFNLFTFLEELEGTLEGDESTGSFELNAHHLARYLWCCLALEGGDSTYGKFRGCDLLD